MSKRTRVLRSLYWCVLGIVLLGSCGLLAVRLWLLPNIDRWREPIAERLSAAADMNITLGRISAEWHASAPTFQIDQIEAKASEATEATAISVASLTGQLKWRALFSGTLQFDDLNIDGVNLTVTRVAERTFDVAGKYMVIDSQSERTRLQDYEVVQWLRNQGPISINDATVTWRDTYRQAPELVLNDVILKAQSNTDRSILTLDATPPAALAGKLGARLSVDDSFFDANPTASAQKQGQIDLTLADAQVDAWAAWVPVGLATGLVSFSGSADLVQGLIAETKATVKLDRFAWRDERVGMTALDDATINLSGLPSDLFPGVEGLLHRSDSNAGLSIASEVDGLDLYFPSRFEGPAWHARHAAMVGRVTKTPANTLRFEVEQGSVTSDDLAATFKGHWEDDGIDPLGVADLSIDIERADISAIYRYVPSFVDLEVRDWLRYGLVEGQAQDAHLTLQGRLDDFPFDTAPGHFNVAGKISGATVDYLPVAGGFAAQAAVSPGPSKPWPKVEQVEGSFEINKTALTVHAGGQTRLQAAGQEAVLVPAVTVHIADMSQDALLIIDGQTQGAAQAYIDLVNHSPLSFLIKNGIKGARGTGSIDMPLTLSIPLTNAGNLAARADLRFREVGFALENTPRFDGVNGRLVVTRPTIRADGLKGRWLGGPITLDGRIGGGGKGLQLTGRAQIEALQAWKSSDAPIWRRVKGEANYTGRIAYGAQDVINVDVHSDLVGVGLDLPAPFGKSIGATLPVSVGWRPEPARTSKRQATLTVEVAKQTQLRAMVSGNQTEPITSVDRAVLAINRPTDLPEAGLKLDVQLPEIDVATWRSVLADFESNSAQTDAKASEPLRFGLDDQPLAVAIRTDRLNVGRLMLTDFNVQARRAGQSGAQRWLAHLESHQAQGMIQWRAGPGHSAGALVARLSHLTLLPSDTPDSEAKAAQLSDHAAKDLAAFPAVDISIDNFVYDGSQLGAVNLVGSNVDQGRRWRLDTFTINNPAARLDAQGFWNATGADRGLSADAVLNIVDAGELMRRMGHPDVIDKGHGTVKGRFTWRDSPWRHDLRDIDGDVTVDIKSGRFVDVDSDSAKILEILSLQSLSRIVQLKVHPGELAKQGFPFDEIQSHLRIQKGVLIVDDYAIDGPVARIKLVGESDFAAQTWDIDATVVPNLDISGAALALGFMVNPVVGVGTFLTQWALRGPLESAMTQRYRVQGSWQSPEVVPLDANGQVKEVGVTRRRRNTEHITP